MVSSPPYDFVETASESARSRTVSVLAKLRGAGTLPQGAQVVSRFGDIVAVRLAREALQEFAASDAVENVELPRTLRASKTITHADSTNTMASLQSRRPREIRATGKGVIVAVVDWGIDFVSQTLTLPGPNGAPRTRLLGIFDMRGGDTASNRWGYGRIISQREINKALLSSDPYETLGYHPGDADTRNRRTGRWEGTHGTHVMDIAAGNGRGGGPVGVAPEADLLFCHLSRTLPLIGPGNLGDSANIIHALDWIFEVAGDRPVVVNTSLGAHSGPHDGTTYLESGIRNAISEAPGRIVVNSAGNYFTKEAHTSGRLETNKSAMLRFSLPPNDPTPNELELWHAPIDKISVHLIAPDSERPIPIALDSNTTLRRRGQALAHVSYEPRNNGDVALRIIFGRAAPSGEWSLRLTPRTVSDGRYHAWIERDSGRQPRFIDCTSDPSYTTGTICNGHNTITVGAVDTTRLPLRLGSFSSSGPTRDGRIKPEVVAPGVRIVAARSTPPNGRRGSGVTVKSGTSMAAPHVAGTIALMQECLGQPVPIDEMRRLFFASLTPAAAETYEGQDRHRLGYGILDIAAAERVARSWRAQNSTEENKPMEYSSRPHERTDNAILLPPEVEQTASTLRPEYELEDDVVFPLDSDHSSNAFADFDDDAYDDAYDLEYGDAGLGFDAQEDFHDPAESRDDWRWEDSGFDDGHGGRHLDDWDSDHSNPDFYGFEQSFPEHQQLPLDVSAEVPRHDWLSEQADPFCQRRVDIARIARQEHRDWNTPRRIVESAPGRLASLVRYWAATGRGAAEAQRVARLSAADRAPWSAAFISFVMRSAGVRRADGFNFSGAHISYIVGALRNRERSDQTRPFWLVDSIELVNEIQLKPGDILCFNRTVRHQGRRIRTNHSYDSLRQQYWVGANRNINPVSAENQRRRVTASHTSVVVGMRRHAGGRVVQCIGGNESNSVRLQEYPVSSGGGVSNPGAHGIFGAIKLTRC